MTEHEAIAYQATIETLESVLAICDNLIDEGEKYLALHTPDKATPDTSRDYLAARAYNEASLDMAKIIRHRIRKKIEEERERYEEEEE